MGVAPIGTATPTVSSSIIPKPTTMARVIANSTLTSPRPPAATYTPSLERLPATATAIARSKSSAPAATAWAPGWITISDRYFTIQIPPSWENMTGNSTSAGLFDTSNTISTELEDAEWHIHGIEGAYADVRVRYEPYSELLASADYKPFQAGDLKGQTRSYSQATGFITIEIVLPGTPDDSGPICYLTYLEMPISLPQSQQDVIIRDFKQAVAHLLPSQAALQNTPTAIAAPPGVQACPATSLSANIDGQGCTGSFCGLITITNTSQIACSVYGRPTMKFISQDGKSLPVSQSTLPPFSGNTNSKVLLKPGGSARTFYLEGLGGCSIEERVPVTASWVMELPGMVGPLTLMKERTFGVCKGDLPYVAYMEVGTFEPVR